MTLSLVLNNPYRVLGVSSHVKNAVLSANYRNMMAEVLKGEHTDISLGQDISLFIKPPLRTARRLDIAKSELMSARGRIFHALFWFIDANQIDHAAIYYLSMGNKAKAYEILESQHSFSAFINLAVLALIENRFDDAINLYSHCLKDEAYTQAFVSAVIGDQYKVKGVFLLSKVIEAVEQARAEYESEMNADERSFAGAGFGVLNHETQQKVRLVPELPKISVTGNLYLRKQAGNFDRHLNEVLNALIDKIAAISREHGVDSDFVDVELNQSNAAQMMIDEVNRFLTVNYSIIETFRKHCLEVRERTMYLDYIYNLVSIVHHAFHLFACELGCHYTPSIVQQIRSISAKLERLLFRLKSEEIEYFIASIRRLEDALPYYHAVSESFAEHYVLSDDANLVRNFYNFYASCAQTVDEFRKRYGLQGDYVDCALHLSDMVVRYNVSFMMSLVNLALERPYVAKVKPSAKLVVDAQAAGAMRFGSNETENADANNSSSNAELNANANTNADNDKGYQYFSQAQLAREAQEQAAAKEKALNEEAEANAKPSPEQQKLLAIQEKQKRQLAQKRSAFFKRKLSRERKKFENILENFESFTISPNTHTLLQISAKQVGRLPPPVSIKTIGVGILLIATALCAVGLNIYFA